ncbi:MAG: hypothetical protein LBD17_01830, partial [Endomicrobium sp.]|nr:hypothetical protein [Endomicrobium sp.]
TGVEGETEKIIRNGLFSSLSEDAVEYRASIYAKLVRKVGSRGDMISWAESVGKLAKDYIERFKYLVERPGKAQLEFQKFLEDLRKNINPTVDQDEAISMLAQHMVTRPVFDALFKNYSFAKNNPVSQSLQRVVDILEENTPEKDYISYGRYLDQDNKNVLLNSATIGEFVTGIDNAEARQKIIVDLYDNFFEVAFKDVVERLGIVYTPVELVDFIINSVAQILKREFKRDISDENIHILEPFTGTGTFITRLLQSGLLAESLERKYINEIHANEILLLPYYIASINIENTYHAIRGESKEYKPFNGICLTDTFQLYEGDTGFSDLLKQNSERVNAQKNTPIMVLISNPPYSVGQKAANDNLQNVSYPAIEKRINETYAYKSSATNKNSLYDSYIKAFRWATERIHENREHGGVIAFITNAGWIDGSAMDGMRKCLAEEFTSIYVLNLRGNARTSGEYFKREGGKIFGSGSRQPVAITFLVKNPNHHGPCNILYSAVSDYMTTEDKLSFVHKSHDIYNKDLQWEKITPNSAGDWINQRNDIFDKFIPIGDKKNRETVNTFFTDIYSRGLGTSRDSWCYNYSRKSLTDNIQKYISFYNEQVKEYIVQKRKNPSLKADEFIVRDSTLISWDNPQKLDFGKGKLYSFDEMSVVESLYRPFHKQLCYFNRQLNNSVHLLPKLFPTKNLSNLVICVSGIGSSKAFSTLISNLVPCLDLVDKTQCFPLYYYEELGNDSNSLFQSGKEVNGYIRHDAITDYIFNLCKSKYGGQLPEMKKIQIFYYVYGLLHSPEYRSTFASDLRKMLPKIPLVKKSQDFEAFVNAGRSLAILHLDYETIKPYTKVKVIGEDTGKFKVQKMRFGKGADSKEDKSIIIYNGHIKITDIPLEAYNYVVNGKSPIEWVMERYQVTINKDTQITNDPNDWAKEHEDTRYILDLILRLITV